jgi:hypothetical protein
MQKTVVAHTANNSMNVLDEAFDKRLIRQGLWPANWPDLNLYNFYLWGTLQDEVYMNNRHSLQELKQSMWQEISFVPRQLCFVSRNIFFKM